MSTTNDNRAVACIQFVRRCNVCLQSGAIGTECKCGNWIGESSHTTETAIEEMKRRLIEHTPNAKDQAQPENQNQPTTT